MTPTGRQLFPIVVSVLVLALAVQTMSIFAADTHHATSEEPPA